MSIFSLYYLAEAVRSNNLGLATSLVDAGCDVNLADRMHQAPIHEAIRQGNMEIIKIILFTLSTLFLILASRVTYKYIFKCTPPESSVITGISLF